MSSPGILKSKSTFQFWEAKPDKMLPNNKTADEVIKKRVVIIEAVPVIYLQISTH